MFNPFKRFATASGPVKCVLLGLLAVEVAALPAAAQMVHRVAFEVRPRVTAVEIPTAEPGRSRFIVTSNAGFGIDAVGVIGQVEVAVHQSGQIAGGSRFGDAAQLPGPARQCAESGTALATPVYVADRKTAARPGETVEQAVVFDIRYDASATPEFIFKAGADIAVSPKLCSDLSS